MNRQWIKVLSLVLNMTSTMTFLIAGSEIPAQAIEVISTDVASEAVSIEANLESVFSIAATTRLEQLTAISWRSAGRGLPGGRIGGAGR